MDTPRPTTTWRGVQGRPALPELESALRLPSRRRTLERMVVPLDGSALAEVALPHAAAIAKAFDAEILLLSVADSSAASPAGADSVDSRLVRAELTAYLDRIVSRFAELGIAASREVAEGRASEQILRFADERKADLLVLSTHGRGGVTEFDVSGTASKVLRAVGCSVLVARARVGGPADGVANYGRVLVPVDCTMRSNWAVHLAGTIARAQAAELVLGTVVRRPEVLGNAQAHVEAAPLVEQLQRLNQEVASRHLHRLARGVAHAGLVVQERVVDGEHVGQALEKLADEEGCTLIVLSAHGGAPEMGWPFGSAANLLLEHAKRPVLVLQDASMKRRASVAAPDGEAAAALPPRWT
jgi:nucleotide-binding universal stress UspA family protein